MLFFTVPTELNEIQKVQIDESLMVKIAHGDMSALHTLYQQTSHAVYGFALSITKNPHDAEDVLQETYIKLVAASKTYTPQGKPLALIFTIAKNLCLERFRGRKQISMEEGNAEHIESISYDQIETLEDKLVLRTVLEKLTAVEQQIIMLHIVAGLKHREIATLLEMPLATVLSKYHRALKRLKIWIQEEAA